MLRQLILAVCVGVVTAIVVALIGVVLVMAHLVEVGNFVKGISAIVGLIAGVWYFFTNQTPTNV